MKKRYIADIIAVFLVIVTILAYSLPIYNYVKNRTIEIDKYVYLGGENIVIDYSTNKGEYEVSSVTNYATVGTMTYVGLDRNYGALGHSLKNIIEDGNIFVVPVHSVIKSNSSKLGEKNINLGFGKPSGTVENTKETGIYGVYSGNLNEKEIVKLGMPKEIKKGEALLYTNVEGKEVKAYKVLIESIHYERSSQNIYVRIIDEDLIEKAGGIIQGMSGSPIVQNGKIIGALSHVDDRNPLYGYALFITYMI